MPSTNAQEACGPRKRVLVRRLAGAATAALAAVLGHVWASGAVVINEFLPDPDGADGGREFVELLNTGPGTVSLHGVVLQFANGAEGAVWSVRWSGTPGEDLEPGARYLIVDRNWLGEPPGQAEVYLGLQNGPDALRLVRDGLVLDLVGYGPLTDEQMMETAPAVTGVGRSLARRPDGWDSNHNGADFVLADPTPGQPNFLPYYLAAVAWELDPPSVDRIHVPVHFTVTIRNAGTETFPVGAINLRAWGRDHPALLDEMPAGQERRISWHLEPDLPGLWPLNLLVPVPGSADTLAPEVASLQVGPGDLVLNEVLAVPRHRQGEWVELAAVRSVDLAAYSLRDQDGDWRPLPDTRMAAGTFLVLAQDSLALAEWQSANHEHGAVPACGTGSAADLHRELSGWPSLNNTAPEDRNFADRIYLAGPSGAVVDHLTLGTVEEGIGFPVEAGLSLERQALKPSHPGSANWSPCTALAGSTPGCPNSVSRGGSIPIEFRVDPVVLDPAAGVGSVHFLFTLTGRQTGWDLRVFDLWGKLVRDLGGESLGPGPRDLLWDGKDDQGRASGSGGYVVLLELRDDSGQVLGIRKTLMVVR